MVANPMGGGFRPKSPREVISPRSLKNNNNQPRKYSGGTPAHNTNVGYNKPKNNYNRNNKNNNQRPGPGRGVVSPKANQGPKR